jgi:hypothetical protein
MKSCRSKFNLGIVLLLAGGALAHASNLYVSDSGSGTILQFDSSGNESVFTSGLNNPAGIAFDSGGNLYVADSGNGTILRYNSSGIGSVFASGLNDPTGLAFDSDGNLYVANQGNGSVLRFNSIGNSSVFASGLGSNEDPTYLAFDNGGNLYVSATHSIEEFSASGSQSTIFPTWNFVYGIASDSGGDLYASLQNAGSITRILGSGGPNTPLGYPYSLNAFQVEPTGLAFDGSGNLYATFTELGYFGANGGYNILNGVVMEFNASGNGTILTTGLNDPNYIAVQNTLTIQPVEFVPEPSTWTMMVAGLVLLGVGCRPRLRNYRKHRQPARAMMIKEGSLETRGGLWAVRQGR